MGLLQNQNPPAFPLPPAQYDQAYMNKLINILRLFLNQVDAQQIISINGIIFSTKYMPTQTSLSTLRSGEVYVDTSAGNVLKIKYP